MKKMIYLISILFAVTLMSTSCEKDEPVVPEQTLEEMYPDWSNLTWVSTDGVTAEMNPDVYPRLIIDINGDNGKFDQYTSQDEGYTFQFTVMDIVDKTVTFKERLADFYSITGTFTNDGSYITLITHGLYNHKPEFYHTYKFKIN